MKRYLVVFPFSAGAVEIEKVYSEDLEPNEIRIIKLNPDPTLENSSELRRPSEPLRPPPTKIPSSGQSITRPGES